MGVAEIDSQHRELFVRTNDLLDAMKRGKGREDVGGLLSFLEEYTVMHFGLEEKYMVEYEYHDLASHKQKHAQFMERIGSEKKKLETEGATVDIAARISILLTQWWIDHIRNVDRLLGIFLKKKGVPSES